jgi:predicted phosphodiesterase
MLAARSEELYKTSMRIAVIADTHGRLPEAVLPSLRSADEIWHLGDVCDLATLSACVALGRPFHAVLGNNDYGLDLPPFLDLVRFGRRFPPHSHPAATPAGL